MTDKEKQIVEMAKEIEKAKQHIWASVRTQAEDEDYLWHSRAIAEHLMLQNYRKIPEGSVIVSKQIWEEHIEKREKANKIFEEQVRKETAEKIIHLVGMIPIPRQVSNRYGVGFENALTVVKLELAKRYGVEVEE